MIHDVQRGEQKVANGTLRTPWARGRRIIVRAVPGALENFKQHEVSLAGDNSKSFYILSPDGKFLVTMTAPICEQIQGDGDGLDNAASTQSHMYMELEDELAQDNTETRTEVEDEMVNEIDDADEAVGNSLQSGAQCSLQRQAGA